LCDRGKQITQAKDSFSVFFSFYPYPEEKKTSPEIRNRLGDSITPFFSQVSKNKDAVFVAMHVNRNRQHIKETDRCSNSAWFGRLGGEVPDLPGSTAVFPFVRH
jgi:hypothetical protein